MKKSAILLIVVGFFVANAAGLYCPECDWGDDEMHIMAASETGSQVPGIISESVESAPAECLQGDRKPKIGNVSQVETEEGYRLSFQGNIQTPNPCQKFGYNLEKNGSTYILKTGYRPENESGMCTQCIGNLGYDAEIEFNDSYQMKVIHQGTWIASITGSSDGASMYQTARKPPKEPDNSSSTGENTAEPTEREPTTHEINSDIGMITVKRQNSTCHDSTGSGIDYESVVEEEGGYSVELRGYIQTPNPCSLLDVEVTSEGEKTVVNIRPEDSGKTCVQCTGKTGFRLETDVNTESFDLEIRTGDTVIKNIRRGYQEKKSVVGRIVSFFLSFF